MGIGVSIFLLAVGAILTFAVHAAVDAVSIQIVGIILMCVGGLGILLSLLIWGPRSRSVAGDEVVERERVHRPSTY